MRITKKYVKKEHFLFIRHYDVMRRLPKHRVAYLINIELPFLDLRLRK